jgi:hypothetical protein
VRLLVGVLEDVLVFGGRSYYSRDTGGITMKISDLGLDERETHISQSADDRSVWEIYTDDPIWIERLRKLGIQEDTTRKTAEGLGKYFILPDNQLTIRRKRVVSEEEKERKRQHASEVFQRHRSSTDEFPLSTGATGAGAPEESSK